MDSTERFELGRLIKWLTMAGPWIFGALGILSASLPFLPDDGRPRNYAFLVGLGALLTLAFAVAAWFSWRVAGKLHLAAVSLDAEGIWPTAQPRIDALVRWNQVAHLRERPVLQRLELLDASNERLLCLEYQLTDFPRLRNIVLSRASLQAPAPRPNSTYGKSLAHHVFNVGSLVGFSALALYMLQVQPWLGVLLGLAAVGAGGWEYLNTVYMVQLGKDDLLLRWPGRVKRIRREDVQGLQVEDLVVNHARHAQVSLNCTNPSRSFKLRNLGVPAVELKQVLSQWWRGAA